MNARRLVSPLVFGILPIFAACGDDSTGTGGGGGAGGGSTVTTGSTSSPASVGSTTSSSSITTGGGSTSDGGGGSTSDGGGGSTSDGGGGFGGSIEGGDVCPGTLLDLQRGVESSFNATTVGFADDYDTCFEPDPDYDGAEVVYQIELETAASVRLSLGGLDGFAGNLIVRSACDSQVGETCVYQGDPRRFVAHLSAGTWSVIVDSIGAPGAFELSVLAADPACGDGILNPGEQCDPGAPIAGDLCNDPGTKLECQFGAPLDNQEMCPGESIDVPEGTSVLLAADGYSTNGFANDYDSSCQSALGGVERVFALTPDVSGTLTVAIGTDAENAESICTIDQSDPGCWDHMLHVRTTCDQIGTEVACSDDVDIEEIAFPVTAGTPIFLFVDGYDAGEYSQGPFNLHFDLQGN